MGDSLLGKDNGGYWVSCLGIRGASFLFSCKREVGKEALDIIVGMCQFGDSYINNILHLALHVT